MNSHDVLGISFITWNMKLTLAGTLGSTYYMEWLVKAECALNNAFCA